MSLPDPSVPLLMTDFSAFPGTAEKRMVVGRLHPQPLRYGIPSLRILDIVPLSQPLKEIWKRSFSNRHFSDVPPSQFPTYISHSHPPSVLVYLRMWLSSVCVCVCVCVCVVWVLHVKRFAFNMKALYKSPFIIIIIIIIILLSLSVCIHDLERKTWFFPSCWDCFYCDYEWMESTTMCVLSLCVLFMCLFHACSVWVWFVCPDCEGFVLFSLVFIQCPYAWVY